MSAGVLEPRPSPEPSHRQPNTRLRLARNGLHHVRYGAVLHGLSIEAPSYSGARQEYLASHEAMLTALIYAPVCLRGIQRFISTERLSRHGSIRQTVQELPFRRKNVGLSRYEVDGAILWGLDDQSSRVTTNCLYQMCPSVEAWGTVGTIEGRQIELIEKIAALLQADLLAEDGLLGMVLGDLEKKQRSRKLARAMRKMENRIGIH